MPAAPTDGIKPYPADFGSGLGGGNWDNTGFTYTPDVPKAYIAGVSKPTTPEFERRVASEIDMRERQNAAYVMANLEAEKWSGNVGLRLVRTQTDAQIATPIPANTCARTEPGKPAVPCAAYPTAITTAGDATSYADGEVFNPYAGIVYYKTPVSRSFTNVLPSLNLRYELQKDMIARFGASRTVGRQNYNVLGTGYDTPTCGASGCAVNGPNPDLRPLTADNIDVSWAWYFKPRALVSVDLFHSNIDTTTVASTSPAAPRRRQTATARACR
jgi:iron complex outermembrane receptor protein